MFARWKRVVPCRLASTATVRMLRTRLCRREKQKLLRGAPTPIEVRARGTRSIPIGKQSKSRRRLQRRVNIIESTAPSRLNVGKHSLVVHVLRRGDIAVARRNKLQESKQQKEQKAFFFRQYVIIIKSKHLLGVSANKTGSEVESLR